VRVCVCVCVRERERECVCVCSRFDYILYGLESVRAIKRFARREGVEEGEACLVGCVPWEHLLGGLAHSHKAYTHTLTRTHFLSTDYYVALHFFWGGSLITLCYARICVHHHSLAYTCTCVYMYMHTYAYMYTYIHMSYPLSYIYMCVPSFIHVYVYIATLLRIHVHAYTYLYIHVYKCTYLLPSLIRVYVCTLSYTCMCA